MHVPGTTFIGQGHFFTTFNIDRLDLHVKPVSKTLRYEYVYEKDVSILILQMMFDIDSPACVIDGLLAQQATEQSTEEGPVFTDNILVSLLINVFEAGKFNIQ